MKKLLILFTMMFFVSGICLAEPPAPKKLNFVQEKFCPAPVESESFVCEDTQKACPVCKTCDFTCEAGTQSNIDYERSNWEGEIMFPMIMTPSNGEEQFEMTNYELGIRTNFNKWVYLQFQYSNFTKIQKRKLEGSAFHHEWEVQMYSLLAGLYLTTRSDWNFAIFGGFGMVEAEDKNGNKAKIDQATIKGAKIDISWDQSHPEGMMISLEYKNINAPNKRKGIEYTHGNMSANMISIGIRIPFSQSDY